jgi:hypothetical protein
VGASVAYVTIVIPSVTSLFILRGGQPRLGRWGQVLPM